MPDPAPHPFDDAVRLLPLGAAGGAPSRLRFQGRTRDAYANMVGPFGGVTAAQMLQAVLMHPQRLGEPVAFTCNFASPVHTGAFTVQAEPVRTNRSTQHWMLRLLQPDDSGHEQTVGSATAVTAVRRSTWGATDDAMPGVAPAASLPRGGTAQRPPWFQRYDMRWLDGALPAQWDGSEHAGSRSCLWVRDDPPRALDHASLLALCDVFFPRILLRRARFVACGTVSFTVYFHVDAASLAAVGQDFVLAQAHAQVFCDGYFDQSGRVWSPDGRTLATTHQVVYYRE